MKQKGDIRLVRQFFASRMFIVALILLVVFIGAGVVRAYLQQYALQREISSLQDEIASLEQKKLESIELLSYVMSPVFAEERARVELNMKKPGERVAVIEIPGTARAPEASQQAAGQSTANPIQWWYYFLHPSYE